MSRRRPAAGATISLFPFLAVLLCTMGALLVLLVIFSRQARDTQTAAASAAEQARVEEIALARDELGWRLEQLGGVRDRTADDLARERMRLAAVEEDARRLADELDALERTAVALERATPADASATDTAQAERRLAAARADLESARAEGGTKPPAYAVVPYEGEAGTHRRPLYVECCIDGVFLQPEGIRLGPGDFEGPPGPGNPLASALRAAREHIARGPAESGEPAAQPYPLLLVRPSGVMAYYAAREALTSWGSEFGYQFVDEDWQLRYPAADPALAAVEQRAIDESRRRMEWLAQSRPARPARPTQQYRASTTRGGVVAEGGPTVLGDRSRFDWTESQADGTSRRGGFPGGGGASDAGTTDGGGTGGGGRDGGGLAGAGGVGDRYAGPTRFYSGEPAPGGGPGAGGGPDASGSAGTPGGVATATDSHAGATATAAGLAANEDGGSAAIVGGSATEAGGTAGSGVADRRAAGGAAGSAAGAGSTAGASGSPGSQGLGSSGMSGGPALPGMLQAAGGGSSAAATGSLAGARGSNWASLATAERPVPLTRPIRVECAANEFRILEDAGGRVETRIPIGTRTADSVDPLVQAVHARVGRWGLAGERMYWRPELVLSETADGRSRREDLERLLVDSGLDTRPATVDSQVRPLPPVTRATAAAAGKR